MHFSFEQSQSATDTKNVLFVFLNNTIQNSKRYTKWLNGCISEGYVFLILMSIVWVTPDWPSKIKKRYICIFPENKHMGCRSCWAVSSRLHWDIIKLMTFHSHSRLSVSLGATEKHQILGWVVLLRCVYFRISVLWSWQKKSAAAVFTLKTANRKPSASVRR